MRSFFVRPEREKIHIIDPGEAWGLSVSMKCMQLMFYSRRHSPTVFFPAFVSYCIYSDYQNTEKFKQRKAELERILKN